MIRSTRKGKIQAEVEQLQKKGGLDEEGGLDKLQIGAEAETGLLCQHRKRTSVAQAQCGLAFQQHHFFSQLVLNPNVLDLAMRLEKMFLC